MSARGSGAPIIRWTITPATRTRAIPFPPIPALVRGQEKRISAQVAGPPAALNAVLTSGRVHVVGVGVPLKGRDIPTQPTPFQGVSLRVEA